MAEPPWPDTTYLEHHELASASTSGDPMGSSVDCLPNELAAFLATVEPHATTMARRERALEMRDAAPWHAWPPAQSSSTAHYDAGPTTSYPSLHPLQQELDYDATAVSFGKQPEMYAAPADYAYESASLQTHWMASQAAPVYAHDTGYGQYAAESAPAPYADQQAWSSGPMPAYSYISAPTGPLYQLPSAAYQLPQRSSGVPGVVPPSAAEFSGFYGGDDGDPHRAYDAAYDPAYLSAPSSASQIDSGPVSPLLPMAPPPPLYQPAPRRPSDETSYAHALDEMVPYSGSWAPPVARPPSPPQSLLPPTSAIASAPSTSAVPTPVVRARNGRKAKSRTAVETQLACARCSKVFALLILRGDAYELEGAQFDVAYTCAACAGLDVTRRTGAEHANQRKRSQIVSKTASCDVCWRDVASGSVTVSSSPLAPVDQITFYTEFICASCNSKYRRCSDCGGGGGPRHGVGKWRTRELFVADRRTCSLDHTRQASATDMVCTFGRVIDFPKPGPLHARILQRCKSVFVNCMLANLASPEMLEGGTAGLTKHEDIVAMNNLGWKNLQDKFMTDIEATSSERTRRYIALRWCRPHPRKTRTRTEPQDDELIAAMSASQPSSTWFQPGLDICGWASLEHDRRYGSIYVQILVPWATGDGFEGTQLTMKHAIGSIFEDRGREVGRRIAQGQDPAEVERDLPPIQHIWTLLFFDRASRVISHMIRRIGFLPLEEYMALYPEAPREAFAPIRPTTRPADQQEGWIILVRRPEPPGEPGAAAPVGKRIASRPSRGRKTS